MISKFSINENELTNNLIGSGKYSNVYLVSKNGQYYAIK